MNASVYCYGSAKRRGFNLSSDHGGTVTLSLMQTPIGSLIEPPSITGSTRVEHEEPIPVDVLLFSTSGKGDDGVGLRDVAEAVDNDHPAVTMRAKAQIVSEVATRKAADSGGGEVVEHRVALQFTFDADEPFASTFAGRIASNRKVTIGIVRSQFDLPVDEVEVVEPPKRRRKAKEPGLPVDGERHWSDGSDD
jgi:hypothetical protein